MVVIDISARLYPVSLLQRDVLEVFAIPSRSRVLRQGTGEEVLTKLALPMSWRADGFLAIVCLLGTSRRLFS